MCLWIIWICLSRSLYYLSHLSYGHTKKYIHPCKYRDTEAHPEMSNRILLFCLWHSFPFSLFSCTNIHPLGSDRFTNLSEPSELESKVPTVFLIRIALSALHQLTVWITTTAQEIDIKAGSSPIVPVRFINLPLVLTVISAKILVICACILLDQ